MCVCLLVRVTTCRLIDDFGFGFGSGAALAIGQIAVKCERNQVAKQTEK